MTCSSAALRAFLVLATALIAEPAASQDVRAAGLRLIGPWARPTPPGAPAGAGYLTIVNRGKAGDRLLEGRSTAVERVEVHEMKISDGVMRMRPVSGGIPIPRGGSVELAPGGYHIMFIGLKKRLVAGGTVPVTLRFERAGTVNVNFRIRMSPPEAKVENER